MTTLPTLFDRWATELASARATLDYRADLDECASMDDVDAFIRTLAGDEPGPFLAGLRQEQVERRRRVRWAGNVGHVVFGGAQ